MSTRLWTGFEEIQGINLSLTARTGPIQRKPLSSYPFAISESRSLCAASRNCRRTDRIPRIILRLRAPLHADSAQSKKGGSHLKKVRRSRDRRIRMQRGPREKREKRRDARALCAWHWCVEGPAWPRGTRAKRIRRRVPGRRLPRAP